MTGRNREIQIGQSRLDVDEDKTIHVTIGGEFEEDTVLAFRESFEALTRSFEGRANCIIDLNKAGKPSAQARRAGIEAFSNDKVGKIALFGLNPIARVVASFVMGRSMKKDMRFFKTKEEALAWLKE
jgi:hypothetical protein